MSGTSWIQVAAHLLVLALSIGGIASVLEAMTHRRRIASLEWIRRGASVTLIERGAAALLCNGLERRRRRALWRARVLVALSLAGVAALLTWRLL